MRGVNPEIIDNCNLVQWTTEQYRDFDRWGAFESGYKLYSRPERPNAMVCHRPLFIMPSRISQGVYVSVVSVINGVEWKSEWFVDEIELITPLTYDRLLRIIDDLEIVLLKTARDKIFNHKDSTYLTPIT